MLKLTHNRAVLLMVAVTLMWSTAGVVTRHLDSARSFEITFWRSCFTALFLLLILPLLRGRHVFARLRQANATFWASGLCWSIMFTAFMLALTLTSVANVLITMSLGPLCTALASRIFIGLRIPPRTWLAIVAAGVGVAIMYGTRMSGDKLLGSAVALCVPIAGAVNWTLVQSTHTQGRGIDLVPAVFVGAVLSSLATYVLAQPLQASLHDVGLLAFLGIFQLAVPCVLSLYCARILKAPEISLLALLEVVFGIALAWLGADEPPSITMLVGGSLVLGALVTNELMAYQQRNTTP